MHLADLNWMDVERYLEKDDRIVLITGATEQHGYLSLLTDIKIPIAIASAVAEREGVLIAPPLNFGLSEYFMEYPGTITLTAETFGRVVTEIVGSLAQHGFKGFFVMNGHGGNELPESVRVLAEEKGLRVNWYNWWHDDTVRQLGLQLGAEPNHANWLENFPFTRVADIPAEDKPRPDLDALDTTDSYRSILGDGSFGGPYQKPDDVMNWLFNAIVNEASVMVRNL